MKPRLIYAHYDAHQTVQPYVLESLAAYRRFGFETVVITTSALDDADARRLSGACDVFARRENEGYDFYSWAQWILADTLLSARPRLVLTNSSVLGPLFDLSTVFREMEGRGLDFWSPTRSLQRGRHLQSYFLVFESTALGHPSFREFWRQILPYRDKLDVIRRYEVALETFFSRSGLRGGAYNEDARWWFRRPSPAETVHPGEAANVSCYYPRELLEAGVPFLKLQVLRENPDRTDLERLLAYCREAGLTIDPKLVEAR